MAKKDLLYLMPDWKDRGDEDEKIERAPGDGLHDGHDEQRPRKVFVRDEKELGHATRFPVRGFEAAKTRSAVLLDLADVIRVIVELGLHVEVEVVIVRFVVVVG